MCIYIYIHTYNAATCKFTVPKGDIPLSQVITNLSVCIYIYIHTYNAATCKFTVPKGDIPLSQVVTNLSANAVSIFQEILLAFILFFFFKNTKVFVFFGAAKDEVL